MKSSKTIQIEFQQVLRQTQTLEKCAVDLECVRAQLAHLMDDLHNSWEGDSAALYLQKCSELSDKLKKSARNLDTTANVIERSARAYRDAELAAIKLAETISGR